MLVLREREHQIITVTCQPAEGGLFVFGFTVQCCKAVPHLEKKKKEKKTPKTGVSS